MFTLVLVAVLANGDVLAENKGVYPDMGSCFEARENILVESRAWTGYLKGGKNAICIITEE